MPASTDLRWQGKVLLLPAGDIFSSKQFNFIFFRCVSFWYQLYGPGVGTLNLHVIAGNKPMQQAWTVSGATGNLWYQQQVAVSETDNFYVVFEGMVPQQ